MITAISPVDGRYSNKTKALQTYFSEYGLIRERVNLEVLYFLKMAETGLPKAPQASENLKDAMLSLIANFNERDAELIKEREAITNHDVKAVEYFVKEKLGEFGAGHLAEWVHFGLTSQDINNTAFPLMIKAAVEQVICSSLRETLKKLEEISIHWADVPMLARTHGQPASPTSLGKEFRVFAERLAKQMRSIDEYKFEAKFGGATGNFNAHLAAYPEYDWKAFADDFIRALGMERQQTTTQIEHYDNLSALFHLFIRINNILLDLCRDVWTYISMDYFGQKLVEGEIGSSTMPHKVNPIDFENAEGNLGIANAIFEHLAAKLPVSRLQRDLTDSTVLRNVGVPFAHSLIAYKSLQKGLSKLQLNEAVLKADLERQWAVLAEPIQTILRREGVAEPYELLKKLTRGKNNVDRESLHNFIEGLPVTDEVKKELRALTPHNYTGYK